MQSDNAAVNRRHRTALDHAQHPCGHLFRVGDDRARLAPRDQMTVRRVGAVGKRFTEYAKSRILGKQADGSSFIKTLRSQGYVFVANVETGH